MATEGAPGTRQPVGLGALQIIDRDRLGGMVCGGVAAPVSRHRTLHGVVVGSVFRCERAMLFGARRCAEIGVDQRQVEVGSEVFRILGEDL